MFNQFTKSWLSINIPLVNWNKRLKSFILEIWYTMSVFFPSLVILSIPSIILGDPLATNWNLIELITLMPFSFLIMALINKDFFVGQSVVHRQLGYQVIDLKTNQPASRVKCMLRNMTAPLWPIEGIFALVYPKRRLGDFIAGTTLIDVEASDPELILNEIRNIKFDRQTKLTLLFSALWTMTFMILLDSRTGLV